MTFRRTLSLCALLLCSSTSAKIITVNTTNNVSPGPGETNLVQAIAMFADGDQIHFNVPGPGPFYLQTPPLTNGYPAITNHNVTIDGYSQPGAVPNSNTILSSNNAQIKIVIDSRAGGSHVENIEGFGLSESATLFIVGATNVTIRGLCFIGPGTGVEKSETDPLRYAIAFGNSSINGHVNGCRIGLDLVTTNIFRFMAGVVSFATDAYSDGITVGVDKAAPNLSTARSQFNVIVGEPIPVGLKGESFRICGNFFNVYPDGLHDYNVGDDDLESFIQIGGRGHNVTIGTDSDGNNDAEERNVFSGTINPADTTVISFYDTARFCTNVIVAGNYVGVGIDGLTRFSNHTRFFASLNTGASARFGSDFDGFADNLEGNVISMNNPFDALFPIPTAANPFQFCAIAIPTGVPGRVSLRGNRMVGNNNAPFSYTMANQQGRFTNIYTAFIQTNNLIPSISTNSTQNRLRGYCAVGKTSFTNIVIDVYLADPEGWTNGQLFHYPELAYMDPVTQSTAYRGFAQGQTYLGSFVENGAYDADPTVGTFDFDISALHVPAGALVTLTANYSPDAPGTRNARTLTTVFAYAHILQPGVRITRSGGNVRLAWPADAGVYGIERSATLQNGSWSPVIPAPALSEEGTDYVAYPALSNGPSYFRLVH
jgi:hypothetical protein